MTKKIWQASLNQKKNSNLYNFEKYISEKFKKNFNGDYQKILNWSIKNFIYQMQLLLKNKNRLKHDRIGG